MNPELTCGTCGQRVADMTSCGSCGQAPEEVRAEVERQVEPLLRQYAALATSTHIYAEYQRTLVEQDLARYGVSQ